jgi:capsular polysaccharide transport system permease protein
MLWLSFLALVVAPTVLCAWYLFEKAADQYVSYVSFAVRSPESSTASPMLEMLGGGSDTTRGDSQILYEYLQSQPLVERVNDRLDLRTIYNDPRADPVFRLGPDPSVEALVEYWNLAQTVSYDSSAGIIYAEIRAFDPDDAQRIAAALVEESEALINDLSAKSRRDAIAFALTDLQGAEARVRKVRLALQDFRGAAGTADVALDIQSAMGLVSGLRAKRAALAAEYDSKKDMLGAQSPILLALGRQLAAVDDQIAQEESRVASAGSDGSAETGSLADAAGRQEELMVERQFAENMYTAALTAVESARAEARRAQRYLAIHIRPTRSDDAEHPRRWTLSLAIGLTALVLWSILQLIGSSIRDRS